MRIKQRLTRLEARVPAALPPPDPKRGKQMLIEVRKCLESFAINFGRLVEDMVDEFGQPSTRREFFVRFGIALAEEPEAKEAVSALLLKHIMNECGSN
jgi:hypothetical protein